MDIPANLSDGGFPAWPLPLDATCAEFARSAVRSVSREFGMPRDLTCDATVIASEIATNALLHAYRAERTSSGAGRPELWAYLRRHTGPEIVIKVFDPAPWTGPARRPPRSAPTDATGGRGLHLVDALTAEHGGRWGIHPTRGRLGAAPSPGKVVFFTVPLPAQATMPPALPRPRSRRRSAERIHTLLTARGLRSHLAADRSVLHAGAGWQVWIREESISYHLPGREIAWLPASDEIEVVERIVRHSEEFTPVCSPAALPL